MRFDMRAPDFGAAAGELYAAALDMAQWGESHGCAAIVISEHHASADGYLPSPMVLASAIAGRTTTTPIQIAAILMPLYDPVRLAEDAAVLDLISAGRVSYVIGLGYRDQEFEMFGVERKGRGRRVEQVVEFLRRAWTGESFEFRGRRVCVTPVPQTPGGPVLMLGGSSATAARRAARLGIGLYAQASEPALETIYRDECAALGRAPGSCMIPPPGIVTTAFVAEDVDAAWDEIGPHMLHDARVYGEWLAGGAAAVTTAAHTVEELRAEQGAYRIFTVGQAIEHVRRNGILVTQPLCGGLSPAVAWRSLRLIAEKVLPAVA